jgi:DNA modification methylase
MTPYYEEDGITIYHGDCLEVLPSLPEVDLIVTSPPYNLVGRSSLGHYKDGERFNGGSGLWKNAKRPGGLSEGYEDHDDSMPQPEYEEWQRRVLTACWDRLNASGAIFYNHKPRINGLELWTPLVLNPGLPLRQIVIWDRSSGFNFSPTYYVPTHEWILIFAKPRFRLAAGGTGAGDVWHLTPEMHNAHPAPFPLGLPATAIETTKPSLVLDPFCGSGTTLVAAKAAGVKSIGIEKSERYCKMAVKRLAQGVFDFRAVVGPE